VVDWGRGGGENNGIKRMELYDYPLQLTHKRKARLDNVESSLDNMNDFNTF
jgi:hypothetical protein